MPLLRVVFNRLLAAGSKSGIGHYAAELFRCLRDQAGADRVEPFPQGWLWRLHSLGHRLRPLLEPRGPVPAGSGVSPARPSWRGRVLGKLRDSGQDWLQRSFQALCRQHSFTLYHEPNYIPLACDLPTLATIHDLSMLLHPEWHPADRVRHFERHFEQGLRQCVHLLTVSEAVRAEIVTTLAVRPEMVSCVPNGIRAGLEPLPTEIVRRGLRRLRLPAQYLLCLGTLEPRKNVLMLMRVYCSLPEELRRRCPLLLVGGWGWNRQDIAAYLEEEARFRGVLHLGYLADRDLPILYNGARALVFPSFYEGFGLPPLEMLACGGAVLASTSAALVETVGGQAHLIDPHDVDGWRQGLLRASHDDDWLASLRQGAVARARPFTWQRCADQTWQVYRSVTPGGIDQHVRRAG